MVTMTDPTRATGTVPLGAVLGLLVLAAGCGGQGSDATRKRTGSADRPVLVHASDPAIQVARGRQVIVIYDLSAKQTWLLFRPRAAYPHLTGKRLAWSEGRSVCYCDLPDGRVRTVENDRDGTPVACRGDVLVYKTRKAVRMHNLADGSTRDFAIPHGGYFYFDDRVLVQTAFGAGDKIRYAKLDTGEVVKTDLKETTGRGVAFRDGKVACMKIESLGNRRFKYGLCILDTATGEVAEHPLRRPIAWLRYVGDGLIGYDSPPGGPRAFYAVDPQTGSARKLFDCDEVSAHYGLDSNGRQLVWGTRPPDSAVWMWDATTAGLREVSAEARAAMPAVEPLFGAAPIGGPDARPTFRRGLGTRSIQVGDGFVAWIEEWQLLWAVPAK